MLKEFYTIESAACTEIEEKKSRFIASIEPIEEEAAALNFINSIKVKYWNATHNVYAYYICGENIYQRFSDDGEPSGTAGMPVLDAIKKTKIQNAVIVVTRYFGGTMLGASGLIRAYGRSAMSAIEAAKVIRKVLCVNIKLELQYTLLGKIQSVILEKQYLIKNILYKQDVEIEVLVPVDRMEEFSKMIIEVSHAQVHINQGEKMFITLK